MMFGQLSNRESLRDLIVAFEAHRAKQYHLGLGRKPIAKTTSFTTREVSFEHRAEEPCYALTLLANFEESGTGIRHEVGLAALGTAINDSAAPTYMNIIFALSLMGDMPTNKARASDNAQKQSACNAVPIFYSVS